MIVTLVVIQNVTGATIGIVFLFYVISPSTSEKFWMWTINKITRLLIFKAIKTITFEFWEDFAGEFSWDDRSK